MGELNKPRSRRKTGVGTCREIHSQIKLLNSRMCVAKKVLLKCIKMRTILCTIDMRDFTGVICFFSMCNMAIVSQWLMKCLFWFCYANVLTMKKITLSCFFRRCLDEV